MRSGNVFLTSIIFHGNLLKQVGGEKRREEEREKEGRKQGREGGSVSFSYSQKYFCKLGF